MTQQERVLKALTQIGKDFDMTGSDRMLAQVALYFILSEERQTEYETERYLKTRGIQRGYMEAFIGASKEKWQNGRLPARGQVQKYIEEQIKEAKETLDLMTGARNADDYE